jgi:hypothetical protein
MLRCREKSKVRSEATTRRKRRTRGGTKWSQRGEGSSGL